MAPMDIRLCRVMQYIMQISLLLVKTLHIGIAILSLEISTNQLCGLKKLNTTLAKANT